MTWRPAQLPSSWHGMRKAIRSMRTACRRATPSPASAVSGESHAASLKSLQQPQLAWVRPEGNIHWLLTTLRIDLQEIEVVLLHSYWQYLTLHKGHPAFMKAALRSGYGNAAELQLAGMNAESAAHAQSV